ncbi:protein TIC110, chloroplastic isoform X2 [Rhododendron vialii]|uniref:protein TIC110, chloroplastic isoform X2 n=1 Tax=Rhododendron vialii TaxID=182163 RepID=UPI00265ECAB8|nr:protein TIC110, chloroplastic isoform X2 [Rhododendron vialii]
MNLSILTPSSSRPTFLFHPSTNLPSLRLPRPTLTRNKLLLNRLRYRISTVRCCSSSHQPSSTTLIPAAAVFGPKKELTGIESLVDSVPPLVRQATSALVFAGAVAAGFGLGLRLGGNRIAAVSGAVALGAAGAAATYAANSCVPEVAAVSLHNYAAGCDDPLTLDREDIEAIANKYGVSKQNEEFNAELCDLYCRFVSSVIPPGGENLKGDEVETIIKFKNALGIDDPDAAAMHMEVGRRIFRQSLETGDHDAGMEQRRAFQKLIYVSNLVFGNASTFLLPWKRVFKVTESQVQIAIRDNAQQLYSSKLKPVGRDIDVKQLMSLREAQLLYGLSDELAEKMFREHTRKLVEEHISNALSILKSNTRAVGSSQVVEELEKILAFNHLLISLKNHPDISRFARGVGPVSLHGGESGGDRKMDDLKLLFRAYVTDALSNGSMDEKKLAALSQLRNTFGLGKREAESIMLDVTLKVYRKRLAQSVSSGDLEGAPSKAEFLQNLCDELHFDPQKAAEIHEGIYREKLQKFVADGELSEEDVKALERLQVMLCIPRETVEAIHTEICGSLFEKVVKAGIGGGMVGYDVTMRKAVRKAAAGLRLTREVAMSIASKEVRRMFKIYLRRVHNAKSATESAKELRMMINFNTTVATQLVEDITGERPDTTSEEPAEVDDVKKDEDLGSSKVDDRKKDEDLEWLSLRSLKNKKTYQPPLTRKGQTEITLRDDLSEKEKKNIYERYLALCLTGTFSKGPLGVKMATKTKDHEFVVLNQLGQILGLTSKEILKVHRSFAEKTFRKKAEVMLADGGLTEGRIEQLNELQKEIGLPPQYAQKVIKSIATEKMAATLEAGVRQGKVSVKEVREHKKNGIDLDSVLSVSSRELLFKKTVDDVFSSGSGEFDEEEVYEKIPQDLNIDAEKSKKVVQELAKSRLSNSLIQAVALLRQRNRHGVVSSLDNLLACDKAVPSQPLSWERPEELADLFFMYLKSDPAPEKLLRLKYLLNIEDSTAEALRRMEDGLVDVAEEQEEFVL